MILSKLFVGIIILGAILSISVISVLGDQMSQAFADSSGSVRQLVGNAKTSIYVSDVKTNGNSGQEQVTVTVLFKNNDFKPQLFNIFYMKLKDSEGREYSPEIFGSETLGAAVPTRDNAKAVLLFSLPADGVAKSFTYSELLQTPLTVDLTKIKNPADSEPKSEWTFSSNKGFSAKDNSMQLTINDETHVGQDLVLDITIKNIGQKPFPYNPLYAYVKDKDGSMYTIDLFANQDTPLSYGDLQPNDIVRGKLAYKLPDSTPVMFIWSGNMGFDSYFNSGALIQLQSQSFPIQANEAAINLEIKSNSKISDVRVDEGKKQVSFAAEGETGTSGIAIIPVGKLLKGPYSVLINGANSNDFEVNGDGIDQGTTMQINYHHSKSDVTILGTEVVPEFPPSLLGVAAAMVALTVAFGRLKLSRNSQA